MNTKTIAARAGFAACLMFMAALPAMAGNTLKDVRFASAAGGKVDITFEFAEPIGAVNAFTTNAPPRIAIDFPETDNGFEARRLAVGSGAASAVSVVEAGGRTRAVIDLFRSSGYTTRSDGNLLVLSLEGGATDATASSGLASPDPAKRLDSGIAVSAVDFRRGEDGSGRVILRFNNEGAQANIRRDGDQLIIDVENAQLPAAQQRRLDVTDFATPVLGLNPVAKDGGTQLVVSTKGLIETSAYQTGNEYILEVTPKGVSTTSAVGQVGGAAQAQRYTGKPVTFNFQDVPVRTILQLVAEESGLNIVAADTVTGNLTLRLINVPWDQALDVVLRAKSLDKRRDGNVVWVAPQKEIADFEQATEAARIALDGKSELVNEMITINYANAEEIAKLLTEESKSAGGGGGSGGGSEGGEKGFLSSRGSVSFDTRSNTLLIADTAKKVQAIKELVAVLDRPVDQVLIEARIVIAQESFARDVGARFGVSGQESDVITSGSVESNRNYLNQVAANNVALARYNAELNDFNAGLTTTRPTRPNLTVPAFTQILNSRFAESRGSAMAFTILGNELNLDIELQALQEEGRGEVVANPRVITANQREALIKQGDEIGYVTFSGGAGAQTATVQFKEAVLELKVTPTITQDNRVFLNLAVKKDEVAGFINVPGGGSVPQITKREVNTAVLINNGQTVVVGGIYEFERREDLAKVPFLGDIPGLGNLFRQRGRNSEKAELLIFVTPRILQVAGAQR